MLIGGSRRSSPEALTYLGLGRRVQAQRAYVVKPGASAPGQQPPNFFMSPVGRRRHFLRRPYGALDNWGGLFPGPEGPGFTPSALWAGVDSKSNLKASRPKLAPMGLLRLAGRRRRTSSRSRWPNPHQAIVEAGVVRAGAARGASLNRGWP